MDSIKEPFVSSNGEEILILQKKLNTGDTVPKGGYRRNALVYPLVCYVNNITACYLSGNYKVVSVFVRRAKHFMVNNNIDYAVDYYTIVSKYISLIEIEHEEVRVGAYLTS